MNTTNEELAAGVNERMSLKSALRAALGGNALSVPRRLWVVIAVISVVWLVTLWVVVRNIGAAPASLKSNAANLVCLLPFPLAVCLAMTLHAQDDRQSLDVYMPATIPDEQREMMRESWLREADHARHARGELVVNALAFGALTSTLLVAFFASWWSGLLGTNMLHVAAAGATAVAVAFCVSLGNILVRSARGDATRKTFALACRCVLFGALVAILSMVVLLNARVPMTLEFAALTGFVSSFLGEPAVETVFQAITIVFGAGTGGDDDLGTFALVEGLDESERLRLNDLGITSLQGLAFAPTPFLYFSTRYGLRRICDWQDQALLLVLVGPRGDAGRWLQWSRGAANVCAYRSKLNGADAAALGLTLDEARRVADGICTEHQNGQIQYWRICTPRMKTEAKKRIASA